MNYTDIVLNEPMELSITIPKGYTQTNFSDIIKIITADSRWKIRYHILTVSLLFHFILSNHTNRITTKQRELLQEEIQNTNKLFLDVKKHTSTILQRINLINKQLETRRELITVYRNEIAALEKEQNDWKKKL